MSETETKLAKTVMEIAYVSGMPDTFWWTDRRISLARKTMRANIGIQKASKWEAKLRDVDYKYLITQVKG